MFIREIKKLYRVFNNAIFAFVHDDAISMCASLSFYTIFSLPPLLMIVIAFTSFIFGRDAVEGQLYHEIQLLVGNQVAQQIQEIIKNLTLYNNNGIAAIIGTLVFLFGASGVFSEIQNSINTIWKIKHRHENSIIRYLQNRLISFSMIGSLSFLMIVCLIINVVLDLINKRLEFLFKDSTVSIIYFINMISVFTVITILFMLIFKTLPGKKMKRKYILVASFSTSTLFMVGKFLIGFYLGKTNLISVYGAAGTMIVILIWVYYSAVILFFGAELAKALATFNNEFDDHVK
jgi:membrane protein